MNAHRILTGVLAVQTLLAVYTWYPRDTTVPSEPVVPWEQERIEKIQLESVSTRHKGGDLVLARQDAGWVVLSEHAFPAKPEPIQELLDRLLGLTRTRPLSDDPSLHKKLNVAEDNFTRRVTLHGTDGEQLEFFAGTASRERMNVRYPGEDEVYEVSGLGAWRLSDNARTYLVTEPFEKPVLDEVTSLTLVNPHGELTLNHDPSGWSVPTGEPLKTAEVNRITNILLSLQVSEPIDPGLAPTGEPEAQLTWTLNDGTSFGYVAHRHEERLVVTLDDGSMPPFLISPVDGQPELLDTRLEDLIDGPAPQEQPAPLEAP